jgi:hypothetical protein
LPISQATRVTPCAAARCDEPFISVTQAQHLKSSIGKELCAGALFLLEGAVRARCALTVVVARKSAPRGISNEPARATGSPSGAGCRRRGQIELGHQEQVDDVRRVIFMVDDRGSTGRRHGEEVRMRNRKLPSIGHTDGKWTERRSPMGPAKLLNRQRLALRSGHRFLISDLNLAQLPRGKPPRVLHVGWVFVPRALAAANSSRRGSQGYLGRRRALRSRGLPVD